MPFSQIYANRIDYTGTKIDMLAILKDNFCLGRIVGNQPCGDIKKAPGQKT